MRKRLDAAFKAKVALEVVRGERTSQKHAVMTTSELIRGSLRD